MLVLQCAMEQEKGYTPLHKKMEVGFYIQLFQEH